MQRSAILSCLAITVALSAAVSSPSHAIAADAPALWPELKLVALQDDVTLASRGGVVQMDPGIQVASLGAPLELRVARKGYTKPIEINQILQTTSGATRQRRLPSSLLLAVPHGLPDFIDMTIRGSSGTVVATRSMMFCPNAANPLRLTPGAPASSRYPPMCADDPFPLGQVWGIQGGWAVDPTVSLPQFVPLPPGTYRVDESITPTYAALFHVAPADTTASATVTVVPGPVTEATLRRQAVTNGPAPTVPELTKPPKDTLPDLVAMPAWGISTTASATSDLLNFGATIWAGGNGPLDVQGFRQNNSPDFAAYQYFWRDGRIVGRTRAGTMFFDSDPGHNHWHFEQFAQYRLLNGSTQLVERSQKVGFCITPTDPVDLLLPHATWQPSTTGLAGQCGSPTATRVDEFLPVGWGDTYFQTLAGQSFDITTIPNGTYYIQIAANPDGLLHETARANDTSLRQVILGGIPGHRTVQVPAWNGIDPEGTNGP